jgi:hypothetical protein
MKIAVFACDLYRDVAPAWWWFFKDRWPGCEHLVEFVTTSKKLDVPAPTFLYGKRPDNAFGWRCRSYLLDHCERDELILLMMVDYLIASVNQSLLERARQLCEKPEIAHVRLRPMPAPQLPYPIKGFGEIKKDTRYSLSLQPGIWEAGVLFDLCQPNENPYHTEILGSSRAKQIKGKFLSTVKPAITHCNYYHKRKVYGKDAEWVMKHAPKEVWPDAAKRRGSNE